MPSTIPATTAMASPSAHVRSVMVSAVQNVGSFSSSTKAPAILLVGGR